MVVEPKPMKGAKALLFERLTDQDPAIPLESQPFRSYDVASVRESVRTELVRLLNTRCPLPVPAKEEGRVLLDYGIPDFSYMVAASPTDVERLALAVERAIAAFEPRLRYVHVVVKPGKNSQTMISGSITGIMAVGEVNEPVSFPLLLSMKNGGAEIQEVAG